MRVDFNGATKPLRKMWQTSVGAGRANEGLRADWQSHLTEVQAACAFRYIRFHGLIHDDMQIYSEENGVAVYSFQYVDALFDALLERNIRPIVEFGFMPEELASTPRTQFWWGGHVAPPTDYAKWGALVAALTGHWVGRYGLAEVKTWYFEVWNEPNLRFFFDGTRSQYFELYKSAALAVKSVSAELRVGGPATSNFVPDARFDGEVEDESVHATFKGELDSHTFKGVWVKEFLDFCHREKLPVDFVSCHPYPTDFALDVDGKSKGATRHRDSVADDLKWARACIAASAYPDAELHCTEWSSSPSSRDYSHDFLPEAAYIVRTNLAASDLCDSLSYWVFTDVFEELGGGPAPFHGGFGLVNLQGVKKPAFHAYRFLCALGERELAREEGAIVTKDGDGRLAALFYNYPDEYKKTIPMSMYPDYAAALEAQAFGAAKRISLHIEGLTPNQSFLLETVGKDDVPANLWLKMGAPHSPSIAETAALRKTGEGGHVTALIADGSGTLDAELELEAWSIALLRG